VFDEKRWFAPGPVPGPLAFPLPGGETVRLGLMVCEDMWTEDVAEALAEGGAEILLVPNGSPFEEGKHDRRVQLAVARVTETGLPLVYVNQVGGQDELVFDGASFALASDRRLAAQSPAFVENVALTVWERAGTRPWRPVGEAPITPPLAEPESVYRAMVLGLRDYVDKNRFPGVVLGLSGGIDSALSAAVAADALGPDRVRCIMMPSRYTSRESLDDAAHCARLLGTRLDEVPIEPAVEAFRAMLAPLFAGATPTSPRRTSSPACAA
jgi:NAD+ synthase